jgi:hypothetical protein
MTGLTSLMFSLIILFLIFMGIAWIINKILKRRVVNGALIFFFLGACLFIIYNVIAIYGNLGAKAHGRIFGTFVIPLAIAFYYARRFKKKLPG